MRIVVAVEAEVSHTDLDTVSDIRDSIVKVLENTVPYMADNVAVSSSISGH